MRCPNCNKFVPLELQEPEVDCLEVTYNEAADAQSEPTFTITGNVRIVRTCEECGQEMKEATLEIEQEVDLGENVDFKMTDKLRADPAPLENVHVEEEVESLEEGGGRYAKSYFGASIHFTVYLDKVAVAAVDWSDKIAASEMDELV